ncbi:MAG TPA: LysR family transcriptional regulator [Pseudomonadales bacterium]
MDFQNLRAFMAVAETNSFSRAADRLRLTQPAISKRILTLENDLNQRLFDRIGWQLSLTEAGECLLPRARQILQLIEQTRQALDDLSGQVQGSLKLVTSHHIGLHRLPGILREYKKAYPNVKLHISFLNSQETHQNILEGKGELGITTHETRHNESLLTQDIWHDPLHFVVARDHPLLKKKHVKLEDLTAYSAILPDVRFYTGRTVSELFQQHNLALKLDADLSIDNLETLKAMVSIGDSWSVLPATMLDDRSIAPLQLEGVALARRLVSIHHKDRTLSKAAQAFLRVLEEHKDRR